jgi:hypothetical protein
MHIHALAAAAVLSLLAASGVAHAQNRPAAEAAFRKGKDLLAAGKVADACASFEQSQKLDPQLGTEYNLALCNERLGKLASAWAGFSELSARDTNARRKADAAKRARALEPRLTRMQIQAAEPVPGLVVTQNGADVTVLVGVASPVDPGTYQLSAQAPGYQPWAQSVAFTGEGRTVRVDIPALASVPGAAVPTEAGDPAQPVPVAPIDDETAPAAGGGTRRWVGLGVGAGGVVSLGVGLVFGLQAKGLNDDAKDLCGGSTSSCVPEMVEAAGEKVDDAKSKGMLANVAVGVGVAAVGAGLYLYLTAPSGDERATALTPVVGDDQVGFAVSGRF